MGFMREELLKFYSKTSPYVATGRVAKRIIVPRTMLKPSTRFYLFRVFRLLARSSNASGCFAAT